MRGVIAALAAGLALFTGCSDVYSQFCTNRHEKIACLKGADAVSEGVLSQYFSSYRESQCRYVLKVTHYELEACSNPKSKALGSDSEGYATVQVFEDGRCYYRAQMNYKSGDWHGVLPELAETLKNEVLVQ